MKKQDYKDCLLATTKNEANALFKVFYLSWSTSPDDENKKQAILRLFQGIKLLQSGFAQADDLLEQVKMGWEN